MMKILMNLLWLIIPQVSDIRSRLKELQPYWVSLPKMLCNDRVATGTVADEMCWNGMSRAR